MATISLSPHTNPPARASLTSTSSERAPLACNRGVRLPKGSRNANAPELRIRNARHGPTWTASWRPRLHCTACKHSVSHEASRVLSARFLARASEAREEEEAGSTPRRGVSLRESLRVCRPFAYLRLLWLREGERLELALVLPLGGSASASLPPAACSTGSPSPCDELPPACPIIAVE